MLVEIKDFVKPSNTTSDAFHAKRQRRQKMIYWVKRYQDDIILVIGVILISLLSFAAGYIVARQEEKEPLQLISHKVRNYEDSYNRSWHQRFISGLETFGERS